MNNVVLVGFMGSGKTTVGRELADRLQRSFVDLDREIEADAGRSIAEIFALEGEAGLRQREGRRLERALQEEGAVIAAGGGAPLADANWQRIRDGNTVVALMAEPAELQRRLSGSNGRPLLQPDTGTAIASLLPARMSRYLEADLLVQTDDRQPAALAAEIARQLPSVPLRRIAIEVPGAGHEAVIGTNLTGPITSGMVRLTDGGAVLLVTDAHLDKPHGSRMLEAFAAAGLRASMHVVPAGEAAKGLEVLAAIYEALASAGVDRGGVLVALGGGTVGDVAGFAAATWMRGIRYLQIPTTLLAMVDSSIGGKTAINLAAGKNLAGAVHQPAGIFADLDYLRTLPEPDYRASLAEVIKAALIADRAFVEWLQNNLTALLRREPDAILHAVGRAVLIKARVVAADPRETGERALLNYGHTVGHALERSLGFGTIRHGTAVAWGMEVAAEVSCMLGSCTSEVARVQRELLLEAGLLAHRPVVDRSALLESLRHDKKSRSGTLRWIVLRDLGRADYGVTVDAPTVTAALDRVFSG
ncbi:MAG TPA: 3-dehydroquinate synthase [Candidatus Dormibacteraeota bacterium]|nr:3-dehydroquinate synthase [Candidatus Dormibacteraeota bacterium]